MKEIISFKSFKNIKEHVIFDYKKYNDSDDSVRYKFVANGIKYYVDIWHDEKRHNFGLWEVEFGFYGQKHEGDRTHKDIKHLNSVLNTVCEISEKVVKSKKIHTLKLQGAGDEKDESGYVWDSNIRSKMYVRFLSNRYGSDKVKDWGRYITLDMDKIFPEMVDIIGKSKMDLIIDELTRISDVSNNREEILRGVNGISDDQFNISTDFIDNKKHGGIYFEINVWETANEFNLEWEFLDEGEEGSEHFDSFEDLLKFLKEFK